MEPRTRPTDARNDNSILTGGEGMRDAVDADMVVAPLIEQAQQTFEHDLEELLRTHYAQWVAYSGNQRLGFGPNETSLYERCLAMGLKEGEFVVRSIEPPIPS